MQLLKVKVQLTATNSCKFKSHYRQLSFAGMCQRGILTSKLACLMFHPYTNQIQDVSYKEKETKYVSLANFVGQESQ